MIQSGRSPGGSIGVTWNAGGSAVASKDSAERRRSPFTFFMTSSGPRDVPVAVNTLPSAPSARLTVAWATVQDPSRAVTLFARTGAAPAASAKPASAATTALPLTMIMSCAASDPILSSPADVREIWPGALSPRHDFHGASPRPWWRTAGEEISARHRLDSATRPATKHAVRALSEGLRQEVKPYNIRTTVI